MRASIIREMSAYTLVSIVSVAFDFAVYFALLAIGIHYLAANVIAVSGAIALNYILASRFVFKGESRFMPIAEASLYFMIGLGGLVINSVALSFLVELELTGEGLAKVLSVAASFIFNYICRKTLLYKAYTK